MYGAQVKAQAAIQALADRKAQQSLALSSPAREAALSPEASSSRPASSPSSSVGVLHSLRVAPNTLCTSACVQTDPLEPEVSRK